MLRRSIISGSSFLGLLEIAGFALYLLTTYRIVARFRGHALVTALASEALHWDHWRLARVRSPCHFWHHERNMLPANTAVHAYPDGRNSGSVIWRVDGDTPMDNLW
jgi:hypothetical protein